MTTSELVSEILSYCEANANEANVIKYSHFFKDAYIAYGLTQPQINTKVKELLKSQSFDLQVALEATPTLIKTGKYEAISFGLLLINGFGKKFTKTTLTEIEGLYKISITNWAHADTLGMFVIPQFLKNKVIDYTDLKHWLSSPYKFQRRTVPVAMIKILKTTPDFKPLFNFIEPLIMDSEREVHQGVGWFLREAWKKQREETETFLLKWKDTAPRLIIQYATEKMTPEEKARFKRKSISN